MCWRSLSHSLDWSHLLPQSGRLSVSHWRLNILIFPCLDCDEAARVVVKEEQSGSEFPAKNVLKAEVEDSNWKSQIWRPRDSQIGWFIIDLGCQQSFDTIREVKIVNQAPGSVSV